MKHFFTLIIFFFCFHTLQAQVFSPDLLCVRSDSLFWDNPVNNCGTFNSYDIFTSTTEDGPFTLLAEITDENQTNFYHANTGGIIYYYLAGNYNCPGQPVIFSDTLDNLLPPIAAITSASVNGSDVELSWLSSNVPEVIGYIIFRETPLGVIPVDTIFGENFFYLDENATADTNTESYYVLALDNCGGTSVFEEEHRTIFLETVTEDCQDFISLTWTPYLGWADGVETYQIFSSINGAAPELVAEISGTETDYNFLEPAISTDYCFTINALQTNGNNSAFSNESCLNFSVIQPVRDFAFTNISVNFDNSISVDWAWNTDAELNEYNILRAENADVSIFLTEAVTPPLTFDNQYIDTTIDPNTSAIFYRIEAADDCGNQASTGNASTIFTQVSVNNNNENLITWTDFGLENGVVDFYEVFILRDGVSTSIWATPAIENEYLHPVEIDINQPEVCYYVVANAIVTLFDGSEKFIKSQSNVVCVAQNSRVFVPNAFAPQGINNEFRAVVLFPETVEYTMAIYDRYGQQIFVTNDVNEGWDGTIKGRLGNQGVYVYHIKVTQENGRVIEKQGTVLLLK